ncbi:hypothetical protein IMCC20628_03490 [Hoeflea sp. IMCC20628]|nr:hypothetical protein IMCC20628_03490 [Hoeflea sp. IMCC20628]
MRNSGHDMCERTAFTLGEQASCVVLTFLREDREPMPVMSVPGSSGPAIAIVSTGGTRVRLRHPDASWDTPESEAA